MRLFDAGFNHCIAKVFIHAKALSIGKMLCLIEQVDFIKNDNSLDITVFQRHQVTVNETFVYFRFGRNHDECLRHIGGDNLALAAAREAVPFVAARLHSNNNAAVIIVIRLPYHLIAADGFFDMCSHVT